MEISTLEQASWTENRSHPQITNQIAGLNQHFSIFEKLWSIDNAERNFHSAFLRTFHCEDASCDVVVKKQTHLELKATIF
jgi:hypothetical protein